MDAESFDHEMSDTPSRWSSSDRRNLPVYGSQILTVWSAAGTTTAAIPHDTQSFNQRQPPMEQALVACTVTAPRHSGRFSYSVRGSTPNTTRKRQYKRRSNDSDAARALRRWNTVAQHTQWGWGDWVVVCRDGRREATYRSSPAAGRCERILRLPPPSCGHAACGGVGTLATPHPALPSSANPPARTHTQVSQTNDAQSKKPAHYPVRPLAPVAHREHHQPRTTIANRTTSGAAAAVDGDAAGAGGSTGADIPTARHTNTQRGGKMRKREEHMRIGNGIAYPFSGQWRRVRNPRT